jgi:sulfur-carrier protein adenylyltransferase/sulfurtransferase
MFTTSELTRYSRHFNLPNFGLESQRKLKDAKVLVVGAGGLGAPLLLYLTAAGVGHIGIVDGDSINLSNLQRQVLYQTEDINQSKVVIAIDRLKALNPHVNFVSHPYMLTNDNALEIISQYDIVADGTDNFPTRYLINDACVLANKINVYAAIFRFEGQVSIFNAPLSDGSNSANYRDLYPTPPPHGTVPDCATGGILGVLAGIIGNFQALEVIKIITGIGEPLIQRLLHYDSLSVSMRTIAYKKRAETKIDKLINYQHFCGVESTSNNNQMSNIKEITVQQLKDWKDTNKDFQLVDVREINEYQFTNINGESIPLGNLMSSQNKIKTDVDVVVMCRSGQRSAAAIDALQKAGFDNLFNLKGGILAWSREIDSSIPQY